MKKPIYKWDEKIGVATCILQYNNQQLFEGRALCHTDDFDMKNKNTGLTIAEARAQIQALTFYRDYEIKPALKAYKQLYYSMNQSKNFNPNSYENKMLQRKISEFNFDLKDTQKLIQDKKKALRLYLNQKDSFYNKVRKNRNKDQKDKNN